MPLSLSFSHSLSPQLLHHSSTRGAQKPTISPNPPSSPSLMSSISSDNLSPPLSPKSSKSTARRTDDATDLLGEKDLDSISALRGLLVSRPADSSFSHKNALHRCVEHAKLWLAKSEQPIGPDADVTYAALREKLNKIMSSEYFTTTPEMKAPVEVAAAAAGGNYVSFHVPVHGSVVPVEVEQPVFQSQEKVRGEGCEKDVC
ncbi:hypothetical protein glysoja_025449 [Glycine soja]|uniref:Uncharacterized protein n=1 Tax=Glycine soja TaxID=3848 RepID=A0A0B2R509_GLYSO|nr:hypothetical protein glysoja_025449 [Glycine soja]